LLIVLPINAASRWAISVFGVKFLFESSFFSARLSREPVLYAPAVAIVTSLTLGNSRSIVAHFPLARKALGIPPRRYIPIGECVIRIARTASGLSHIRSTRAVDESDYAGGKRDPQQPNGRTGGSESRIYCRSKSRGLSGDRIRRMWNDAMLRRCLEVEEMAGRSAAVGLE
jgi:hypothetical protein